MLQFLSLINSRRKCLPVFLQIGVIWTTSTPPHPFLSPTICRLYHIPAKSERPQTASPPPPYTTSWKKLVCHFGEVGRRKVGCCLRGFCHYKRLAFPSKAPARRKKGAITSISVAEDAHRIRHTPSGAIAPWAYHTRWRRTDLRILGEAGRRTDPRGSRHEQARGSHR